VAGLELLTLDGRIRDVARRVGLAVQPIDVPGPA
jgi:hypothetical protein